MAPGAPAATSASSPFCRFGESLATGFAIADVAPITAALRQARIAPTANRRRKLDAGDVWRCDFVVMAAPIEGTGRPRRRLQTSILRRSETFHPARVGSPASITKLAAPT